MMHIHPNARSTEPSDTIDKAFGISTGTVRK